jgi:hypothetical protein
MIETFQLCGRSDEKQQQLDRVIKTQRDKSSTGENFPHLDDVIVVCRQSGICN